MGRIFLICPSTGRLVDTAMNMSPRVFRAYEPKNARSFCPHCHRTHRWTRDRMRLGDENPPASKRA